MRRFAMDHQDTIKPPTPLTIEELSSVTSEATKRPLAEIAPDAFDKGPHREEEYRPLLSRMVRSLQVTAETIMCHSRWIDLQLAGEHQALANGCKTICHSN